MISIAWNPCQATWPVDGPGRAWNMRLQSSVMFVAPSPRHGWTPPQNTSCSILQHISNHLKMLQTVLLIYVMLARMWMKFNWNILNPCLKRLPFPASVRGFKPSRLFFSCLKAHRINHRKCKLDELGILQHVAAYFCNFRVMFQHICDFIGKPGRMPQDLTNKASTVNVNYILVRQRTRQS